VRDTAGRPAATGLRPAERAAERRLSAELPSARRGKLRNNACDGYHGCGDGRQSRPPTARRQRRAAPAGPRRSLTGRETLDDSTSTDAAIIHRNSRHLRECLDALCPNALARHRPAVTFSVRRPVWRGVEARRNGPSELGRRRCGRQDFPRSGLSGATDHVGALSGLRAGVRAGTRLLSGRDVRELPGVDSAGTGAHFADLEAERPAIRLVDRSRLFRVPAVRRWWRVSRAWRGCMWIGGSTRGSVVSAN